MRERLVGLLRAQPPGRPQALLIGGSLIALTVVLDAAGCAAPSRLRPSELTLVPPAGGAMTIVKLDPSHPDPESVLRARAEPVDPADPDLAALIASMRATLSQGGVGLAAPQVGISRRIIVVKRGTRPLQGEPWIEAYVNPELEWASGETDEDWEACLSLDVGGGLVRRPTRIRLSYVPEEGGARRTLELGDWDARIAQHELDHLDGVLFVDRVAGELVPIEEMRRRRDAKHKERGWIP